MSHSPFVFKQFKVNQEEPVFKVNTDGVLLAAWLKGKPEGRYLEIGCGTGVLSLMIAQKYPKANIESIDLLEKAVELTKQNIELNRPLSNHISCFKSDVKTFSDSEGFDIIFSNPPYYSGDTLSDRPEEVLAKHDAGLNQVSLLESINRLSKPDTLFYVIYPFTEGNIMIDLAKTYGWFNTEKVEVKPNPFKPVHRLLLKFERKTSSTASSTLIILDEQNQFSEAYRELTKDFYLKF